MAIKQKTHCEEPVQTISVPIVDRPWNQGLLPAEVALRQENGLSNLPVESPTKSEKQIVKDNVFTYFNLIFIVLAGCLIAVGSFGDMLFLFIAIANTLIGIFQEIRAKRTIDKLTLMKERSIVTIRDGTRVEVRTSELVRDDIVEFVSGDQICADAIVRNGFVQVNESLVTGEADPLDKRNGDELLSGSFVVSGHCRAQLTRVGPVSYASQLTLKAKENVTVQNSEMMKSLDRVIRIIGIILIPIGAIMFIKQFWILNMGLQASVQATVAALIGMIPEGLYLLTSIALAVSTRRLAAKKVLTQDMSCIENLARVDVLCVDKTGTITEASMEVGNPVLLCEDLCDADRAERILSELYNAAEPENETGAALARRYCLNPEWVHTQIIPFSSDTKRLAVSFETEGSFLIGAPEFILPHLEDPVMQQVNDLAARGYRVLLLASYDKPLDQLAEEPDGVSPLALIPLTNKIRDNAADTFRYFVSQDVEIRVISGDNPLAVSEVARQAGIPNSGLYIDASTLNSDEKLREASEHYKVFGRVTPDQKRKLIQMMKDAGHTVAMTGDGVNDVLALKDADCGIAMASGSEAACQVAQLVLLDNEFSHMPDVVYEGRRVINNIQRAASLFIVKNIFSFMLSLISIFIDIPYPLIPLHLSVISGLTIGIPAFFLAMQPNTDRIEGKFLLNVLIRALPGGLTDVFLVMLCEAFVYVFDFPLTQLYTMSASVLAVIGLRILYQVCKPLDRKRTILLFSMAVAELLAFTLFAPLFNFTHPTLASGLVLAVLIMLSFQVMRTVLQLFEISGNWIRKQREKDDLFNF